MRRISMNETLLNLLKNSFGFDPTESPHHFAFVMNFK
jgi:hypothetical protein